SGKRRSVASRRRSSSGFWGCSGHHRRQGGGAGCSRAAHRVAVATGALAQRSDRVQQASVGSCRYVVDDIIVGWRTGRIHPVDPGEMIEDQSVTNPPGDEVVGAGGVAADTKAADPYTALSV